MSARAPYDYSQATKPPEPSWEDELSTPRGSHEDVIAAYKEELKKVKDALHLAMSASGAEALESRYLAQIKRNKNLTVQLASERSRCLQMERNWKEVEEKVKAFEAEQEKQRRKAQRKAGVVSGPPLEMIDIVKDVATRRAKERMGYDATTAAADAKMQPKVNRGGVEEDDEDDEEVMQETIRTLRERLDRSFKMIAERDAQVNESRREAQLWRQVVQRETGATKEEVDRILRDALQAGGGKGGVAAPSKPAKAGGAKPAPAPSAGGGEEDDDSDDHTSPMGKVAAAAAAAGGPELRLPAKDGWRGRAQTIILLKGKLKDAEEALRQSKQREEGLQAALAAAAKSAAVGSVLGGGASTTGAPPRWTDDGTGGGDDLESLMALAQLTAKPPASERTTLPPPTGAARSTSGTALKDVDDEARDHLTQLGNRRLQQQRELEATVEQLRERLTEEQRRHKALQGRFTTVQRDAQQLRQHVEVILQKSQADDELIAAYKEELLATQEELRDAKEWNAELLQDHNHGGGVEDEDEGGGDNISSNPAARDRRREFILAERRRKAEKEKEKEKQEEEERKREKKSGEVSDEAGEAGGGGGGASERASQEKFFAHLRQHLITLQSQQVSLHPAEDSAGPSTAAVVERLRQDFESLTEYTFAYMKALEAPAVTREQKWDQLYRLYQALQHSVQEALAKTTAGGGPKPILAAVKELETLLRQVAALPPLEESVLRENAQLKDRLRTLSALLEKVEAARHVWVTQAGLETGADAVSPQPKKSSDRTGDGGADVASVEMLQQYQKLQKDYAELKKEFNRMQMKRMNNDPNSI